MWHVIYSFSVFFSQLIINPFWPLCGKIRSLVLNFPVSFCARIGLLFIFLYFCTAIVYLFAITILDIWLNTKNYRPSFIHLNVHLFSVIHENRQKVLKSRDECRGEEFSRIEAAELSVELIVGNIDCDKYTGEFIETKCTPISSLSCVFVVMNVTTLSDDMSLTCR